LLVYKEIDIDISEKVWRLKRFAHTLSEKEVADAVNSFSHFPGLVSDLTEGEASVKYDVVHCDRPITQLTEYGDGYRWPSPRDISPELEKHAPVGKYDSLFVFWPQRNFRRNTGVKSGGWGLAVAAHPSSHNATYATVANAETWVWEIPLAGEVWLHEWLHGVCAFYQKMGYRMPAGDADGGDRHGYVRSPETGWTGYYRDLMTGRVCDGGVLTGIPLEAWRISPSG
jgi:hypothetical protein